MPICHLALACVEEQLYILGGKLLKLVEENGESYSASTVSTGVWKRSSETEEWVEAGSLAEKRYDASVAVAGTS